MEYIEGVLAILFIPFFIGAMLLVAFWEKDTKRTERQESPKEKGQRPKESAPAEPKSAGRDGVPIEDLPYQVLGINRNADGYETLGVRRGASKQDVDSAFKQKQQGWHPDKKMANAVSKILNNARDQIYRQRGWK
jgi:hypothetical protein